MPKIVLSVSSDKEGFNCKDVSETLKHCGIETDITQLYTNRLYNGSLKSEIGCRINLYDLHANDFKETIWQPLKTKFNFDCAHLSINGRYSGCIHEYFYESKKLQNDI